MLEETRKDCTEGEATPEQTRGMRPLIKIGLWICAIVFLAGGVIVGKSWLEDGQADRAYTVLREQMMWGEYRLSVTEEALTAPVEGEEIAAGTTLDFTALRAVNQEIVAWISGEGTPIDYPVLQTDNNAYYLTHLYTKESNRTGALFVDCRNDGGFTDRNTVIYGHNLNSDVMFGSLTGYKQQDYYDAAPVLRLCTPEGDYRIELFAGAMEDGNYEFVQLAFADDQAFLEYVDDIRARSTFQSSVVVEPTDRIVTLCTCSYEWNNARYIVMGKLCAED